MTGINDSEIKSVNILGSLPPLRALSSYCLSFFIAISRLTDAEFISFKSIYPPFLYPGGDLREDHTFPEFEKAHAKKVRRNLTWYNPFSWIMEGFSAKGELLHAQWWSPPLVFIYITICIIFKIRKRPIIFTVHNITGHEKNPFFDLCSRVLFRLGDHFIVHSEANRERLIGFYGIKGRFVSQIPHGPLIFKCEKEITREDARKRLRIGLTAPVILFFGAIRPYKGLDIALDAFAGVLKKVPDACLIIAGRLWEPWDRYEKIIKEKNISDHIKEYLGYINTDEVGGFFIASDLVILPYLKFDSQSGVGSTAIAYNKPMIVSKTGGLPELVLDQKNTVTPGDPIELSERSIFCLKNPEEMKKMSQHSKIIAERISWENIAKETFSVYERVINKKRPA